MEHRRCSWLVFGANRERWCCGSVPRDGQMVAEVTVRVLAVIGFIFFFLAILSLAFHLGSGYSFHFFLAVFLILEITVILVSVYPRIRSMVFPRSRAFDEVVVISPEPTVVLVAKDSKDPKTQYGSVDAHVGSESTKDTV